MEFGVINIAGAVIVAVMLLPDILYALRNKDKTELPVSRGMGLLEQTGRYASMVLMVLPLGVWKFGFSSVLGMLVYLFGNGAMLISYLIAWVFYFRKPGRKLALLLAALPAGIFLLSGLTLRHWLLVAEAVVFVVAHIYITDKNHI